MRKNFLLLFLLTLLPFSAGAQTADLLDADVSFSHIQYGGGFPVMQVLYKGHLLEEGEHFTWDGKYYTDAACETEAEAPLAVTGEGEKYYVKLIGKEGTVYENSATKGWFTVEPADLKITAIANVKKDYNGSYSDIEVGIDDITFDGFVLEEDEDDLEVADHILVQYGPASPKAINAGEYTITGITGISSGNYNITLDLGEEPSMATINTINFPANAFEIEGGEVVYSATAAEFPTLTTELTTNDYTLTWHTDDACATAAVDAPIHVGDYYAKITGKGNYAKEGNVVKNAAWKLSITRKAVMAYVQNTGKVYDGDAANLEGAEIVFNGMYAADNALKEEFEAQFVEEGDKINVGEYAMVPATEAGEPDEDGIIDAEGFGDYTFNLLNTGVYAITQRPVTVKAKNQTFDYTGEEQHITTTKNNTYVEIAAATDDTGLVGEDDLDDISGLFDIQLKEGVTIQNAGNAAYTGAILIVPDAEAIAESNYTIDPVPGNVVMNGKDLVLIAGTFSKPYGYELSNNDLSVVNTGGLTADDWKVAPTFTVSQGENTYNEGDVLDPGVYTVAISNAEDIIPDNFTFTNTEGTDLFTGELTITAKPITITINEVKLNSGDGLVALNHYASCADYSAQLVKATDEIDFDYVFAEGIALDEGDVLKAAAEYELTEGKLLNAVDGDYDEEEADNGKYVITFVKGAIKLGAAQSLLLDPTDPQLADKIEDAANAEEEYSVSFANLKMNIGEWYAMVLPFDIDPKEMVKAADRYVVFNELNETGTTDQNFKFTLKFEPISAGTPFLVKFAANADDEENEITKVDWSLFDFGEATFAIDDETHATETEFVTFDGTYEAFSMQNNKKVDDNGADLQDRVWWLCDTDYNGKNTWLKPTNKPHTVAPMEAYLVAAEGWTSYAPTITVEDFDGTVTAIKSISANEIHNLNAEGMYNLNGMKMNSVPTQKGVYIVNGKKVVIK